MTHNATTQKVIEIVRKKGMLRPRELDRHGIPRVYLSRLCERGLLQRINRGLYTLPEAEQTEHHTLAEVCKRVPNGVLCLLSALRFHQITTQAPFEIWLALKGTTWHPKIDRPRIRFVRFSGPAFDTGIDQYKIEGVPIKVYNPAKTVADCFKYRNKIGLDVAIEALRECRRDSKCTNDELWEYAKVCRVSKVMKPYMEAMV
jgi:predicted transcriptional regulator of viral defense system